MSHYLFSILALVLGPAVGFQGSSVYQLHSPQPSGPSRTGEATSDTLPIRWVMIPEGSEARYRVREQLAGFDLPNDAVGATRNVTGTLVLAPDGAVVPGRSEFRVQLATLTTDNERRDRYVRLRTLEVEDYPEAVLVPLGFPDLPWPLPDSGTATFRMEAHLTLHGETRAAIWEVEAEFAPDAITGFATTSFRFNTFGLTIPQVARVLSVDDNIRLELDFHLVPGGTQ